MKTYFMNDSHAAKACRHKVFFVTNRHFSYFTGKCLFFYIHTAFLSKQEGETI